MTDSSALLTPNCEHCGHAGTHAGACPKIKAIEYYADGSTKRVEYFEPTPIATQPVYWQQPGFYYSTTWGPTTHTG